MIGFPTRLFFLEEYLQNGLYGNDSYKKQYIHNTYIHTYIYTYIHIYMYTYIHNMYIIHIENFACIVDRKLEGMSV